MAKVSAKYEVVYIVNPTKSEEETAALVAKFTALAEQHASAVEVEEWGKRKLAYEIDDQTEGYYVGQLALHDRLQRRIRRKRYAQSHYHHGSLGP